MKWWENRRERKIERDISRIMVAILTGNNAPMAAIELMKRTGLGTGALYVAIARARSQGWLERILEDPTTPGGHRRARYALSERGHEQLPHVLEKVRQEPMPRRWRWSWLSR